MVDELTSIQLLNRWDFNEVLLLRFMYSFEKQTFIFVNGYELHV